VDTQFWTELRQPPDQASIGRYPMGSLLVIRIKEHAIGNDIDPRGGRAGMPIPMS
jgi:hypothetical protein